MYSYLMYIDSVLVNVTYKLYKNCGLLGNVNYIKENYFMLTRLEDNVTQHVFYHKLMFNSKSMFHLTKFAAGTYTKIWV